MGKKQIVNDALDVAADIAKSLAAGFGSEASAAIASVLIDELMILKTEGVTGYEMARGVPLIPNPLFDSHGIDGNNRYTKKYIEARKLKTIGGAIVSAAGGAASAVTVANVGGIIRHGAADTNTIIHLVKLSTIAKRFKRSDWLSHHAKVLIWMKYLKLGVRSTQLVGDALGGLAGALCGLGATVTSKGVLAAADRLTTATATQLHWRAYQEQAIMGGVARLGGGSGPAGRMVQELLTRRAHVWLGGQYDWKAIVKEPAGWLAIHDKITLI